MSVSKLSINPDAYVPFSPVLPPWVFPSLFHSVSPSPSLLSPQRLSALPPCPSHLIDLAVFFMGCTPGMQLHLLLAVGLKVTNVAAQVQRGDRPIRSPISRGHRGGGACGPTSLSQVGCQLVLLSMFVSLEVELEVGLELRAIAAELAAVGVTGHLLPFSLWEAATHAAVVEQQLQVVCAEDVAHEAAEHLQGRAVIWGRRGGQAVGQGA